MKRTRMVLGTIVGVAVIGLAGCSSPGGGGGDAESSTSEDGPAVKPGASFKVEEFKYAGGWSVGPDEQGKLKVTGLKATNTGDDDGTAELKMTLWADGAMLGSADCASEDIEPGATAAVACSSEDVFDGYSKITVEAP